MAYSEELANDVRVSLDRYQSVTERKMFGGIAFMVDGNMAIGVTDDDLMVRVGKEAHTEALARPGAETMTMGEREMQGWVRVGEAGWGTDSEFEAWVDRGVAYARSLPPK